MAKRVQVERLRPKTQNDVFVRPVNTYVTPAPDQETALMKLSKTVDRLVPGLERKLQSWERAERKKWEDDSRDEAARAAAKGVYDTNEAVKQGLISPDASPVAHYKLNELHGQALGFEFSSWLSNEYLTDPIRSENNPAGYRDWYLKKHEEFSTQNADVLAKEGASTAFLTMTDSVFNSSFNQHKQVATKNFIAEAHTRFSNKVMHTASSFDLSTTEGQTAFGLEIEQDRQEMYETQGIGFRESGELAIDALITQFSKTNDYKGLATAVSQLRGGTGALVNTHYAKEKLAQAQRDFTKAALYEQQQEETIFKINQDRTVAKWGYLVNQKIAAGVLDPEQIERELREENPEVINDLEVYDPDWRTTLMDDAKKYTNLKLDQPMYVTDIVPLRQELEGLPPAQRVGRVNEMARDGRITDKSIYASLYKWAESSEAPDSKSDATKDSVFKQFNETSYKKITDKYLGTAKADRLNEFMIAYYDKFDEMDEEGNRVWHTMSYSEKQNWLHSTMREIIEAPRVDDVVEPETPTASPMADGAENPMAGATSPAPKNPVSNEQPTNVTPSGRTFTLIEPVEPEPEPQAAQPEAPKEPMSYPWPEGSIVHTDDIIQNISDFFKSSPSDQPQKGYPWPEGSNIHTDEILANMLDWWGLIDLDKGNQVFANEMTDEELYKAIQEYLDKVEELEK